MEAAGIVVEEVEDFESSTRTSFGIVIGQEEIAGRYLLDCLGSGSEISLRNDLDDDEGNEGCTLMKRSATGIVTKVGGHGWSGHWGPIDEPGVIAKVRELADLNRGGHWSRRGSMTRPK